MRAFGTFRSGPTNDRRSAADDVAAIWRASSDRWFEKDAAFDAAFHDRFLNLHMAVAARRPTPLGGGNRQHVREGSQRKPRRGPAVIVGAMPTHVDHRVDRGRPSDDFPARALYASAICIGLQLVKLHPVVETIPHDLAAAERNGN